MLALWSSVKKCCHWPSRHFFKWGQWRGSDSQSTLHFSEVHLMWTRPTSGTKTSFGESHFILSTPLVSEIGYDRLSLDHVGFKGYRSSPAHSPPQASRVSPAQSGHLGAVRKGHEGPIDCHTSENITDLEELQFVCSTSLGAFLSADKYRTPTEVQQSIVCQPPWHGTWSTMIVMTRLNLKV